MLKPLLRELGKVGTIISTKYLAAIATVAISAVICYGVHEHRAIASVQQAGNDGARRIKPEEVRELLKKHQAVLIDVRGEAAYKAGHVKGALNIPAGEILNRAKELPRDKMIATYCS